jgi:hypothetical protein
VHGGCLMLDRGRAELRTGLSATGDRSTKGVDDEVFESPSRVQACLTMDHPDQEGPATPFNMMDD